jgi:very-short-patch-repair endonuclease
MVGRGEADLAAWLAARGLRVLAQHPVGPYNIDLAVRPVAVEVHFAANNPVADARLRKRTKNLLDWGWDVVYVWVTGRHPLIEDVADEVVAVVEAAKRQPSARREYRVIRGAGEYVTSGCSDGHDLTIEPSLRRAK